MDTSNQGVGTPAPSSAGHCAAPPPFGLFIKQRRFAWVPIFVGLFLLLLGYCLLITPQTLQSSASISMQNTQSPSVSSLLGLGGGASKSYTGVIKSRNMAKRVAKDVHLREMLNLPSEEAAYGMVAESLKFEDTLGDGLMYFRISLTAPPLLRAKPERVALLSEASARIANDYPEALRNYIMRSDTDKDLTLLRAAQSQLQKFRQDYTASNAALIAYLQRGDRHSAQRIAIASGTAAAPSAKGDGAGAIASQLQRLYENRGQLEENKIYLDTEIAGSRNLLSGGVRSLADLPAEDEILTQARYDYNRARDALAALRISYGETNPQVVGARERVKLAENRLEAQLRAIRTGKTSAESKRRALDAELELVRHQIGEVEGALQGGLEGGLAYEQLRREQELRFETLKQGVSYYNTLSLQTVSAQNKISVVDEALAPKGPKISLRQFVILSLLGGLIGAALYMALLYLLWEQRSRRE